MWMKQESLALSLKNNSYRNLFNVASYIMHMNLFPQFWFEGNLSFGWVRNLDDLHKVFERYQGQLNPNQILDKAKCRIHKRKGTFEYGLKRQHSREKGAETLREFFLKHSIEFNF